MSKTDLHSAIASMKAQTSSDEGYNECDCVGSKTCWMKHDHMSVSPIEADQIISLTAMITYVSHKTGRSEYRVERDFADHFCIPNLKCLPSELYDTAIHYIVDQVPTTRC